ncbi:hypothetical protein OROGR_011083 [Orobanche gracilis]
MMNWVKNTAYSLGYVIVTQRSKNFKNSLIQKLFLMCDRSGKPDGSGSSRNTSTKKTDCPFQLVGKYSLENHYWTIRVRPRFLGIDLNVEPARHSSYTNYHTNYDRDPIPYLNEETTRHSSFVDLNEEPSRHNSYVTTPPHLNEAPQSCYIHRLMGEIPLIFHPFITYIQDVTGDGNCGFRAISVCLGYGEDEWLYVRRQLLDELLSSYHAYARVFSEGIDELHTSLEFLQSPAPPKHWMLMPES